MEEEEEEVGEVTHISTSILVETEGKYNLAEVARRFVGEADGRAAMTVLRGRLWAGGCIVGMVAVGECLSAGRRRPCRIRSRRQVVLAGESPAESSAVVRVWLIAYPSNYPKRLEPHSCSVARGFNQTDEVRTR